MTAPTNRPRAGEPTTTRIKVGAHVRLSEKGDSEYRVKFRGMVGVLAQDDGSCTPYLVRFANGDHWWFNAENIEQVVKRKATKEINYQTLSLSMYKAKSLREARAIYEKKVGKK